jgi:hypothetical protein
MLLDKSSREDEMKNTDANHSILSPINIKEKAKNEKNNLFLVFGSLYMI